MQVWVQVPLTAPDLSKYEKNENVDNGNVARGQDTWDWWNRLALKLNICLHFDEQLPKIRTKVVENDFVSKLIFFMTRFRLVANSNSKINLCLCVTEQCPEEVDVMRWVGEPVKTVRVPTSIFLLNKKGYPVLSKQHQNLIRKFIALDIQVNVTSILKCKNK